MKIEFFKYPRKTPFQGAILIEGRRGKNSIRERLEEVARDYSHAFEENSPSGVTIIDPVNKIKSVDAIQTKKQKESSLSYANTSIILYSFLGEQIFPDFSTGEPFFQPDIPPAEFARGWENAIIQSCDAGYPLIAKALFNHVRRIGKKLGKPYEISTFVGKKPEIDTRNKGIPNWIKGMKEDKYPIFLKPKIESYGERTERLSKEERAKEYNVEKKVKKEIEKVTPVYERVIGENFSKWIDYKDRVSAILSNMLVPNELERICIVDGSRKRNLMDGAFKKTWPYHEHYFKYPFIR